MSAMRRFTLRTQSQCLVLTCRRNDPGSSSVLQLVFSVLLQNGKSLFQIEPHFSVTLYMQTGTCVQILFTLTGFINVQIEYCTFLFQSCPHDLRRGSR